MSTYHQTITEARANGARGIKTCHIAHVRAHHGLTMRAAHNRIDPLARTNPCPEKLWRIIEDAMRKLGDLK